MIIIQWSFWLVETDPSLAQNFAVNHHGPYWNGFKFVWISIIRHTQIHQIHCLNPYWSRHHEITMKIPILRRARCQVRSILFLLATFEDEALLMAKSLPDQVGVAGMASCFCWLQWWWGTGFGSSKIRKLAILWCCKVIWPSSIRSSPVKWIWVDLCWFEKWNTSEMAIEYNKISWWTTRFIGALFSDKLILFVFPLSPGFLIRNGWIWSSGVETTKQMRGFGHEIHGRSVRIELGNIFKLVSWENPPFVKHPSSAIHHRRETISQMTKTVRKVLVRSKPSNTAAWWFHVDFPPYLGWSPIISP